MNIWMNFSMQNQLKREGYDVVNDSIDLLTEMIRILNTGFRTEQELPCEISNKRADSDNQFKSYYLSVIENEAVLFIE